MRVKETVYIRPAKVLTTFNLLAQIVPSKEPFPGGKNYRTTLLDAASLEYSLVHHLFTSTGGPAIRSITKLENKSVQEAFMMKLKQDCRRYPNKSIS